LSIEKKVGFIGLGIMGSRLAKRLLQHGCRLSVFNRNRAKADELVRAGAFAMGSIPELAADSDLIISCLADDQAVVEVYEGEKGALAHARPGTTVIEMSTVAPETPRQLSQLGQKRGLHVLDVPISGSTLAVEQGNLTLFTGGEYPAFEECKPIFQVLAKQAFYLGPSGSGATMKLVVNALLGMGMQGIAEAVAFGRKAGIDRNVLLEVLSKTAVVAPAHAFKLDRIKTADYSPQFPIRHMNKDFHLITEKASLLQVPMPATAAAYQINLAETSRGQDEDFSAVMKTMEELSNLDGTVK
jgi:3-hydroxyisobutyrate dehydrogenase/glyoxylate/succinic semialdehyde reductase